MIQIRFKITLPLIFLLLFGLFIWLVRDPGSSQRRQPVKPAPRRPRPEFRARPARTIIVNDDEDHEPPGRISYADALRSNRYSPEELTGIGNREALEAGLTAYEQAHQTIEMPTPIWRKKS